MDWTATRALAASCAASSLLFALFAVGAALSVALYGAWRGLRHARAWVPPQAARLDELAREAAERTHAASGHAVGTPIRVLAWWAGLVAFLRALIGGRRSGG